MHVLLIHPLGRPEPESYAAPPLGVLRVAGALEEAGHCVRALDLSARELSWEDALCLARAQATDFRADCIGLSLQGAALPFSLALARELRSALPGAMIIGGGPAVGAQAEQLLSRPEFDALVRGDGEQAAPVLLAAGKGAGPRIVDAGAPLDVDQLPPPAYHLIDPSAYRSGPGGLTLLVECGRGCSLSCFVCTGCGLSRHRPTRRPASAIVREAVDLQRRFSPARLSLFNLYLLARPEVRAVCDLLAGRDVPWFTQARIDALADEDIPVLARAGCQAVLLAAEEGPARKPGAPASHVDYDRLSRLLGLLAAAGIQPYYYLPNGCAGGMREDAAARLVFAARQSLAGRGCAAFPLRGTESGYAGPRARARVCTAAAVTGALPPGADAEVDSSPASFACFFVPDGTEVPARIHAVMFALAPAAVRHRPATLLALAEASGGSAAPVDVLESVAAARPEALDGPSPPPPERLVVEIDRLADQGAKRPGWSWLGEVARYEAAATAGPLPPPQPPGPDPALRAGVQIAAFEHDIPDFMRQLKAGQGLAAPAQRPCYLAFRRQEGCTTVFRLTEPVYRLLESVVAGAHSTHAAPPPRDEGAARVMAKLKQADLLTYRSPDGARGG